MLTFMAVFAFENEVYDINAIESLNKCKDLIINKGDDSLKVFFNRGLVN